MIKDIQGYEDLYAVDEMGNVWSLRNQMILKPYVNTGGYLKVNLSNSGKIEHRYIHRLVAAAFVDNPDGLNVVNHINANPADNRAENLEWCSQGYNIQYSRELGNQNDIPVRAFSPITGEVREFCNLREAGRELFGKQWALGYLYRKYRKRFFKSMWVFEVIEK